jgi:hypothetical protein
MCVYVYLRLVFVTVVSASTLVMEPQAALKAWQGVRSSIKHIFAPGADAGHVR